MTQSQIKVIYTDHGGEGYHCVLYMARLAAKLLDAELLIIPAGRPRLSAKLRSVFPPRRSRGSSCLFICPSPTDLNAALLIDGWTAGCGRCVAWVFDSFWTTKIPRWVRTSRIFHHVFVTEQEDLGVWRQALHADVEWLPWGSDALNLGSARPVRQLDLLRFGRQPGTWDDDLLTEQDCNSRNLRFQGRPRSYRDATDNERALMDNLGDAKFALAFSNRVSPSVQTHPTREYITGRWTDALAAGATVAGIPPRCDSITSLLWPEALLDIETVSRGDGLEKIATASRAWMPSRARINYLRSLERLDWRWRFEKLAKAMNICPAPLSTELGRLGKAIASQSEVAE